MNRDSPSWSEEFPSLRIPSPQLRELDALSRELAPEISGVEESLEEEEPPFQIAGETVENLAFRINCGYNNLELATEEATKLLSKKYEVLQELDRLDPGQGWLVDGARFIKKKEGSQYTWRTLTCLLQDIRKHGTLSKYFFQFWKSRRGQ